MSSALRRGGIGSPLGREIEAATFVVLAMPKERVLIVVKTYPTLSRKYGETVCTAGIRADGTWVRIYPVPFRRLEETEQYRKLDWVELDLIRNNSDPRPESYHPADIHQLVSQGHI